jgi:hypothetical protein
MTRRATFALPLVAILVFAAGLAYTAVRHVKYVSSAQLVLVPTPASPAEIASLTSSFANSGTLGTYVEYVSSINPNVNSRAAPVTLSVRAVPDTRAINVTATGTTRVVRPALENAVTIAQTQSRTLNDAWTLRLLKKATTPSVSGPSTSAIVLASALIAVLAAVVVYIVLDRSGAMRAGDDVTPRPAPHAQHLPLRERVPEARSGE